MRFTGVFVLALDLVVVVPKCKVMSFQVAFKEASSCLPNSEAAPHPARGMCVTVDVDVDVASTGE